MTMRNSFKLSVCGAGAVGKSCCTISFINPAQKLSGVYDPTIQDSYMKEVDIEGQKYFLEVIDTAGQDEYDALRDQYMRESDGFLIVYDITDRQSFAQVNDFVQHINMVKEDSTQPVPMVLVGNKYDLKENQKISDEEARRYAKDVMANSPFFYASAIHRINIDESFNALILRIVKQEREMFERRKKDQTTTPQSKTSCCNVM